MGKESREFVIWKTRKSLAWLFENEEGTCTYAEKGMCMLEEEWQGSTSR